MKKLIAAALVVLLGAALCAESVLVDKIMVVVNDEAVTKSEFDELYIPAIRSQAAALSAEQAEKLKKDVINQLISEKLIVQEARKRNIEISKGELDSSLEQVKAKNGGAARFSELLKNEGMTEQDVTEKLKNSLLTERIIKENVMSEIKVELKDIQELYDQNKDQFADNRISFKRMLIKPVGGDDAKAKTTAETAARKLKEGSDFAEIAKLFSNDDYSRESAGEAPRSFDRGDLEKTLADMLFALKDGETADPVKMPEGYAVFRVIKKEVKLLGLGDIVEFRGQKMELRVKLRQVLYEQQYGKKSGEYIAKLKEKAVIDIKAGN